MEGGGLRVRLALCPDGVGCPRYRSAVEHPGIQRPVRGEGKYHPVTGLPRRAVGWHGLWKTGGVVIVNGRAASLRVVGGGHRRGGSLLLTGTAPARVCAPTAGNSTYSVPAFPRSLGLLRGNGNRPDASAAHRIPACGTVSSRAALVFRGDGSFRKRLQPEAGYNIFALSLRRTPARGFSPEGIRRRWFRAIPRSA